jgi:hypothetical protein
MLNGTGIIILFVAGAVSGFILRKNKETNPYMRFVNRWANLAGMVLFIIQGINGSLALVRVI